MSIIRLLVGVMLMLGVYSPAWARTYRVATTPWMGWAFLDVASAKGFWKAEGLTVELLNFPDGTSYMDAQLAGLVDFSCGMVGDVVWLHTHQRPCRILLETDWSLGGDKFFLRKGRRLEDLGDSPLGLYQARYALPFFLRKTLGASYRHLQGTRPAVFTPEDLVAQFRAGRLDAGIICDPFAEQLGPDAVLLATSADVPGSLPECFFGTQDRVADTPPQDLASLTRGIQRAMAWMQAPGNGAELFAIVRSHSFSAVQGFTARDMAAQMRAAPSHPWPRLLARNAPGGGLEAYLGELRAFLVKFDPSGARFKPGDLFEAKVALGRLRAGSPAGPH